MRQRDWIISFQPFRRHPTEVLDDATDADHPEAILEVTDRLAALRDGARRSDHLTSRELHPETVDLTTVITGVVGEVDSSHKSVPVPTSLQETAPLVTDSKAISTVLRIPLKMGLRMLTPK